MIGTAVNRQKLGKSLNYSNVPKIVGMFVLCLSMLTACGAGTPRPAKSFMSEMPQIEAGPVINANLETIEIETLKWIQVCYGCKHGQKLAEIPPIVKDDLHLIKTSIFDQTSHQKLSLTIEKLHLKSDITAAEMFTGEVSADANATYVLKRTDGTEIFREDIQSKGTATFSDALAHASRKTYAQRYAAFSNFDAFRLLLVAKSKEINGKLK